MSLVLKNWKKYLPIIGILLFVYILVKIDIVNVWEEIRNIDLGFLFIGVVFVFVMLVVQTYKWFIIARKQGMEIGFGEAIKINIICNFYGFVTPSKLGGVVRADYLKKYSDDKIGKGLFNFTIDKILDISSVVFMAVLFSFIFQDKLDIPILVFTAIFLGFVFLVLFFIEKDRSKWALSFIYRRISGKFKDKAKVTFDSFYESVPKKRYFAWFFLWNVVSWLSIYFIFYFIGLSLGIELSFFHYLAIMPLGTLVAMIPISISGLGTREAALITLFGLFEVSAAKVFSLSIITLIIVVIIPSIIGIFLIFDKKLK